MKAGCCESTTHALENSAAETPANYARRQAIKSIAALSLGALLMASDYIYPFIPHFETPHGRVIWFGIALLTFIIMIYAAGTVYRGAFKSFLARNANMDTLIAIGTASAFLYSVYVLFFPTSLPEHARHLYFDTALVIIGLIDLGAFLETRARGKTSEAIKRLVGLQPKTARIIQDGEEKEIPLDAIKVGDKLRVRPGEKIAVDGEVIEGESLIDESMLTGEPMPLRKMPGSLVSAGTLNQSGSLVYRAERIDKETALQQIIEMVQTAQNSKPAIGRLVDVIAHYFVPTVLIIAILTALAWFNWGPTPKILFMLITSITVLIIACPCALGLGTPMSIMVGVGKAAQYGILIRNGEALQNAARLTTIVLDKTGTITEGKPTVTEITAHGNFDENKLLQIVASVETASEHPLGAAIINAAKQKNLPLEKVSDFHAESGRGVTATVAGKKVLIGNRLFLTENSIDTTALDSPTSNPQAATTVYCAIDNKFAGIIFIADPIKSDSRMAIDQLHRLGLKVVMLTGDNQQPANVVAAEVMIDEVYAELLPQDKLAIVSRLQNKGEIVGMVGDGINDAPALAKAHVGFAIGAGTDVAIESSDITLIGNSLMSVVNAIAISKATLRNIKQNLVGAFLYNVLGIPIAAGVLYPLFNLLLNPIFAAAAMALSSLTIVINANRLRHFKPKMKA